LRRLFALAVGLAVALGVLYVALAESGEVVVLETQDASGAVQRTRLWVVDDAGFAWLRTGDATSPWLARVRANPDVTLTRGGERRSYRAVPVEDAAARDRINALTLEKYGWREQALRLGMETAGTTPIRLEPR
jgi:hypothetical protein